MENTAHNGLDRTEYGVAAPAMPNSFASNTILLCGERERDEGGCQQFHRQAGHWGQAPVANQDANVLKLEEVVGSSARGNAVLARAEEKKVREEARRRQSPVAATRDPGG